MIGHNRGIIVNNLLKIIGEEKKLLFIKVVVEIAAKKKRTNALVIVKVNKKLSKIFFIKNIFSNLGKIKK